MRRDRSIGGRVLALLLFVLMLPAQLGAYCGAEAMSARADGTGSDAAHAHHGGMVTSVQADAVHGDGAADEDGTRSTRSPAEGLADDARPDPATGEHCMMRSCSTAAVLASAPGASEMITFPFVSGRISSALLPGQPTPLDPPPPRRLV